MTPNFQKTVWVPALLAVGSLVAILGRAWRSQSWRLLTVECVLTGVAVVVILWLLRSVRSGEAGKPLWQEVAILLILLAVVVTGAVQVMLRR